VGVQDRRLRELSGDGALWRAHCRLRWPGCSAAHYDGDYARMYRTRAALPSALVRAADRCHMLTVRASAGVVRLNSASLAPPGGISPQNSGGGGNGGSSGSSSLEHSQNNNSSSSTSSLNNHESSSSSSGNNGSVARGAAASSSAPCSPAKPNVYGVAAAPYASTAGMLFDEVAQAALSVGLALAGDAGAGRSHNNHASAGGGAAAEVARFRADAAWWLSARPEVVVRFVRRSCDALQASSAGAWGNGGGGNGGAFASWPDVPWRRSALQVLLDLGLGPQAGVCPSVTERLQRCVRRGFDYCFWGGVGEVWNGFYVVHTHASFNILSHSLAPNATTTTTPHHSEADRLDAAIRGLRCNEPCHLEVRRPAGVPRTHWWYFLSAAQGPQQMATAG
jgi:hypothetical protein